MPKTRLCKYYQLLSLEKPRNFRLVVAPSTFGFLIDEIETEFLRADCTSEFSRGQDQSRHQLARLLWHAPPYGISAGTVGDAPCDIRRQPCAHSHFEQFSI